VLYEDGEWEFVNLAIEPAGFGSKEAFVLPGSVGGAGGGGSSSGGDEVKRSHKKKK